MVAKANLLAFALAALILGLGALIAQSVVLFTIVKVAGAVYLMYLGVQAIRHREMDAVGQGPNGGTSLTLLREEFLVGFTKPKTVVFLLAVLPQFVAPAQGNIPWRLSQLGGLGGSIMVGLGGVLLVTGRHA